MSRLDAVAAAHSDLTSLLDLLAEDPVLDRHDRIALFGALGKLAIAVAAALA